MKRLNDKWRPTAAAVALVALGACGQTAKAVDETDVATEDTAIIDGPGDATEDALSADATPTYDVTQSVGLWTPIALPDSSNVSLHSVWSDGSTRVVAAGTNGTIVTWDGLGWKVATSGKFATLNAVAGSPGAGLAYAVGMGGTIVQSAGSDGNLGKVWAPPGGCLAPTDCDDADPCTTDVCDSGVCQHASSGAPGCCGGIAFGDSFDGGLGKWTVTDNYAGNPAYGGIVWKSAGVYGIDGILHASSPPAAAYFGRTDVPCADDASKSCATYDNGKTVGSTMTSQEFTIPPAKSASLTFQLYLDVEQGFYDTLQVSVIASTGGKTLIADKQNIWPSGTTNGKFSPQTLDLTPWVGQKIRLEVRFETYSSSDNGGQGAFLDDLLVSTACASGTTAGKGVTQKTLFGAWAFADNDAYAVGDGGVIAHWDGTAWGLQAGATTGQLDGLAGIVGIGLFAVGDLGVVGSLSTGGVAPTTVPTQAHLYGVGVDSSDGKAFTACAVGAGGVTLDGSSATGWKLGPSAGTDLSGVTSDTKGGWLASSPTNGAVYERKKGATAWSVADSWGFAMNAITHTTTGQVIAVGEYGGVATRPAGSTSWSLSLGSWTSATLHGVSALADDDIWAAGDGGIVGHYQGTGWAALQTPTPANLRSIWAASPTAVYAVGLQGAIVRWDGKAWKKMLSPSVKDWYAVWGNGPDDVYAIGEGGQIAHWDGQDTTKWTWKAIGTHIDGSMRAVWGLTPDDVWAVGEQGLIYHTDGTGWIPTPIPDYKADETAKPYKIKTTLLAIWGSSWDNVWAVGEPDSKGKGVLVHWDGSTWAYDPSFADESRTVRAMWGWGPEKILMAGTQGMVLRFDGKGKYQELHPGTIATLFGITGYGKDALLVGDIGTVLRWTPLD